MQGKSGQFLLSFKLINRSSLPSGASKNPENAEVGDADNDTGDDILNHQTCVDISQSRDVGWPILKHGVRLIMFLKVLFFLKILLTS